MAQPQRQQILTPEADQLSQSGFRTPEADLERRIRKVSAEVEQQKRARVLWHKDTVANESDLRRRRRADYNRQPVDSTRVPVRPKRNIDARKPNWSRSFAATAVATTALTSQTATMAPRRGRVRFRREISNTVRDVARQVALTPVIGGPAALALTLLMRKKDEMARRRYELPPQESEIQVAPALRAPQGPRLG